MVVTPGLWILTIAVFAVVMVIDFWVVEKKLHRFTHRDAITWVVIYFLLAMSFAVYIWLEFGPPYGGQFIAGYLTEYSLSVDNLFVFMVLMSSFAVPTQYQHRVLLVGVIIALLLRGILIAVGAAAISAFGATFFVFGAFLLYTAWKVWTTGDAEPDPEGNALVRWAERHLPSTRDYHGPAITAVVDGKRVATPMFMVMVAIGTTDLLFALDSIPAVFGLTHEAYIVLAANAFALMGLRQLYFLLVGLLDKLIYLSKGLAIILGFIAVKLILEATADTTKLHVPHIGTEASLAFIVGVLAVTAAISLVAVKRNPELAPAETRALSPEEKRDLEKAEDPGLPPSGPEDPDGHPA